MAMSEIAMIAVGMLSIFVGGFMGYKYCTSDTDKDLHMGWILLFVIVGAIVGSVVALTLTFLVIRFPLVLVVLVAVFLVAWKTEQVRRANKAIARTKYENVLPTDLSSLNKDWSVIRPDLKNEWHA